MNDVMTTPEQGLELAVAAAGSQAELARRLGITRGAIAQWRRIPAERVPKVAEVTGVPPSKLRPDLFASAA